MENPFLKYSKKGFVEIRNYIPGEDLTGISVNREDSPAEGGMIARNPDNHADQWYISKKFFEDHYDEFHNQTYVPKKKEGNH